MKSTTTTVPSTSRNSFYSKKRSPASLNKRKESPLAEPLRRTPSELLTAELAQLSPTQCDVASREIQSLLEPDYRDDIKSYMFEMEAKTTASIHLIDQQPELQWYMRPYLVDFLIEIHQQHRLRPETLYLALNIVDRYVSKRIVFKKHYQLVGCAALWIAAKFEDAKDRVPTVPELCQMCCGAYDESAFLQMEGHVLSTINWVLGHPTTESWLRLACTTGQIQEQGTQHIARFLMEITLFHKEYIAYKPSELAVASLLLARFILGKTRRVMDESAPVLRIAAMLDLHLAEHLDTVSIIVVKKYSLPFYSRASTFVQNWYLSGRRFTYCDPTSTPNPVSSIRLAPSPTSSVPASPSPRAPSSIVSSPSARRLSTCSSTSSSSPSSSSSSSGDSWEDRDDIDEPLTPNTPLSTYSFADADGYVSVEKDDMVLSSVPLERETNTAAGPVVGLAMKGLDWEVDSEAVSPLSYR